ncbi:MAG: hypothetical protein ACE5Z5_02250 [Candidatus Bathyarchaeia archaeon]
MKTLVMSKLGELVVITDRPDWHRMVEVLVEVAGELGVPLPRALYDGPPEYERLIPLEEVHDRHLVGREVSGKVEYWHRDQMVLFFGRFGETPLDETKGLLAHELMHHLDNIQQRNVTSYALFCAPFCKVGFPSICVDYIKACVDTLRNVSINSRLSPKYSRVCLLNDLTEAQRALDGAKSASDEVRRRLSFLFSLITATALALFKETKGEVFEIHNMAISSYPTLSRLSNLLRGHFERAVRRRLDQSWEREFLSDLRPIICCVMREALE